MILLPYSTEVVIKKWPISNLIIIGLCSISFIILVTGGFAEGMLNAMVLYGWNPIGLVGHQFPHAGLWHPVFNMLCLWIFGNAVCEKTGNGIFAGI